MIILELNFERTWRGGERQTLFNMLGFRNIGVQVELVCRKGYPLEQKARAEGLTVHAFDNIMQVWLFLATKGGRYAVLHAQTSHILTWCVFSRPFHRAKILFTRRVDFVPHGMFTRMKYRSADKLIAISTAVQKIVAKFSGKDVVIISDIVGERKLDKVRAESILKAAGVQPDTTVIATTAAFVPHKDPLNMVEAIKLLAARRKDFVFLHFGSGELEDEVKSKISEYGLQDVYKLMGFHDDVEDIFSVIQIFVMSSQEEGLGSSVLDAFVYRVPVVSTNAGGLMDLLQDNRGIVCGKKKPADLAAGIEKLLIDPNIGMENARRAYSYVNVYHGGFYITTQYMDVISKLGVTEKLS